MKDTDILVQVKNVMLKQCSERSYVTPVDVLMDLGVLAKQDYLKWRNGKVDYLERLCHCNLSKLSKIMKAVRQNAKNMGLKPSFTYYKQWGKKGSPRQLRFSKSGSPEIEKNYATHYAVPKGKQKQQKKETNRKGQQIQKEESKPSQESVATVNRTKRNRDYSWQFLFRLVVLERGITLYFYDQIKTYQENDETISAAVQGTDLYQIEIRLKNNLPDTMTCTCPYARGGDWKRCKHMAAVLCQHYDYPRLEEPRDEVDVIATDLSVLADDYSDRNEVIGWKEGPEFIDEFRDYLRSTINGLMKAEKVETANEALKCAYMLLATVEMNGSFGEHSTGFECCRKLWKNVLQQGTDDMERKLYDWFKTMETAECYRNLTLDTERMLLTLFSLPNLIERNCRMLEEELVTCELEQSAHLNETLAQYIRQLKKLSYSDEQIRIHCERYSDYDAYQNIGKKARGWH